MAYFSHPFSDDVGAQLWPRFWFSKAFRAFCKWDRVKELGFVERNSAGIFIVDYVDDKGEDQRIYFAPNGFGYWVCESVPFRAELL